MNYIPQDGGKGAAGDSRELLCRSIAATLKLEIGGFLREAGVPFAFYKLDELFQTAEAADVLDALRAIENLNDHSRLRRAWMSPFFALKYREVATISDPPPSHPLNQLLYEWRALADAERF